MSEEEGYISQSLTATNKILVNAEVINPIFEQLIHPDTSVPARFRAVFTLSNLGGPLAREALEKALLHPGSALLKHEIAYVLGQIREPESVPTLAQILRDETQEDVVRHEAGEALGAIATPEALVVVQEFLNYHIREIRETCELAVERINFLQANPEHSEKFAGACENFHTVDPAPPMELQDTQVLGDILVNEDESLFKRYRALFALRDLNNDESVKQLVRGFNTSSALLRHEVAYVLGQMQNPTSFDGLKEMLAKSLEHPMVRHEAAEALGALPLTATEITGVLGDYLKDPQELVSESCVVALDYVDYYNSDQFEYANAVLTTQN